MCDHTGFGTTCSLYDHVKKELRGVIICDSCGAEVQQVFTQPYEVKPNLNVVHGPYPDPA